MKYRDGTRVKVGDWIFGFAVENERVGGQVATIDDVKKLATIYPTHRLNPAIVAEGRLVNFDVVMGAVTTQQLPATKKP